MKNKYNNDDDYEAIYNNKKYKFYKNDKNDKKRKHIICKNNIINKETNKKIKCEEETIYYLDITDYNHYRSNTNNYSYIK